MEIFGSRLLIAIQTRGAFAKHRGLYENNRAAAAPPLVSSACDLALVPCDPPANPRFLWCLRSPDPLAPRCRSRSRP
ncbi:hypothetical protein GQ55_9G537400 [Panicum hallii var. hallii]|uniref:Uncharacterized protein n=1 Tax=Panicum hallii var. hallii TaxID=1504633 RepID=A0A2T7CF33_9POAL|nr:hypothetical protein GQ55_9G537400 [Panicum hallii var. hallii]